MPMGWIPPLHKTASRRAKLVSFTTSEEEKEFTMEITRIGVDIAKNLFQVHGVDTSGEAAWTRQLG